MREREENTRKARLERRVALLQKRHVLQGKRAKLVHEKQLQRAKRALENHNNPQTRPQQKAASEPMTKEERLEAHRAAVLRRMRP